ncbi:hypothetical protein BDN72DRAFT_906182 [Pluteus cervinus]|uniref:Uncharacterized protein n=1 Tax=Pluteus cervinus TaxID=181527 RepID=A0ACD3A066_9AGAR|nr:hypothetical protein BDN72DRAFT_906182 [Pluteus cervinus]
MPPTLRSGIPRNLLDAALRSSAKVNAIRRCAQCLRPRIGHPRKGCPYTEEREGNLLRLARGFGLSTIEEEKEGMMENNEGNVGCINGLTNGVTNGVFADEFASSVSSISDELIEAASPALVRDVSLPVDANSPVYTTDSASTSDDMDTSPAPDAALSKYIRESSPTKPSNVEDGYGDASASETQSNSPTGGYPSPLQLDADQINGATSNHALTNGANNGTMTNGTTNGGVKTTLPLYYPMRDFSVPMTLGEPAGFAQAFRPEHLPHIRWQQYGQCFMLVNFAEEQRHHGKPFALIVPGIALDKDLNFDMGGDYGNKVKSSLGKSFYTINLGSSDVYSRQRAFFHSLDALKRIQERIVRPGNNVKSLIASVDGEEALYLSLPVVEHRGGLLTDPPVYDRSGALVQTGDMKRFLLGRQVDAVFGLTYYRTEDSEGVITDNLQGVLLELRVF